MAALDKMLQLEPACDTLCVTGCMRHSASHGEASGIVAAQ